MQHENTIVAVAVAVAVVVDVVDVVDLVFVAKFWNMMGTKEYPLGRRAFFVGRTSLLW